MLHRLIVARVSRLQKYESKWEIAISLGKQIAKNKSKGNLGGKCRGAIKRRLLQIYEDDCREIRVRALNKLAYCLLSGLKQKKVDEAVFLWWEDLLLCICTS